MKLALDIHAATAPAAHDNDLARGIKHDYRRIHRQACERQRHAQQAIQDLRMAAGPQRLPGGDLVRYEQGLVITEHRNGSREEVELLGDGCRLVGTDVRGRMVIIERQGDLVSYNDGRNHTHYSLKDGQPHQHIISPYGSSCTQVYADGSTSTVSQPLEGLPRYFRSSPRP